MLRSQRSALLIVASIAIKAWPRRVVAARWIGRGPGGAGRREGGGLGGGDGARRRPRGWTWSADVGHLQREEESFFRQVFANLPYHPTSHRNIVK